MIGVCGLMSLGLLLSFFRFTLSELLEGDFTIEYDTYFTNNNVKQARAKSLIQCAHVCLKTSTCQYAAFNKNTESCIVAIDSSYDSGTYAAGWIFIKAKKASEAVSATISCADCVGYGSSLYKFVDTPLKMFDAKLICENLGGKLVEVETDLENNFLKEQMLALNSQNSFWMGAYSYTSDSSFEWFSKPNEPLTFTEFDLVEPNNPTTEFCVAFFRIFGYSWADERCNNLRAYVCEFSV